MKTKRSGHQAAASPWWREEDEFCPHCIQTYALTVEYCCVACDNAICPACAVTVRETLEVYCPQCADEEQQSKRRVKGKK